MNSIAILASGMVTGVGLDAPSSCAAIRCAIDNFSETRFMDKGGEWIIGSQVQLDQPWRGLPKLVHMVVPAIRECLAQAQNTRPELIPLLLCVAEKERPGRLEGLDDQLFAAVQTELGVRFHPRSTVIPRGRVAGGLAMIEARRLMERSDCRFVSSREWIVSWSSATLASYEEKKPPSHQPELQRLHPGRSGRGSTRGSAIVCRSPLHRDRYRAGKGHGRLGGTISRRRDGAGIEGRVF